MYLDGLASCAELTSEHLDEAAASSTAMRALLTWAERVARPGQGAPRLLLALARLPDAEWIEGTPYVEVLGAGDATVISVFTSHGGGIRERVFPTVRIPAPVHEFLRAVDRDARVVQPMRVLPRSNGVLLAPIELDEEDMADAIAIDERSLHEQARKTAPPPPPTEQSGIHTRPTVRRMVAVNPELFRRRKDEE